MLLFSISLVILMGSALLAPLCQRLSFPCRGTQNWPPYSRCSVTSGGWRGPISSPVLLAVPLQRQPGAAWCAARDAAGGLGCRGHRSLVFSALSYHPQLLLLWSRFPSCWPPACTGTWVYSIPAAEILGVLVLIPVTLYPLLWTN